MSGQTVWPSLYLILATQASNFYHGFYNTGHIQSKNKDAKSALVFFY